MKISQEVKIEFDRTSEKNENELRFKMKNPGNQTKNQKTISPIDWIMWKRKYEIIKTRQRD